MAKLRSFVSPIRTYRGDPRVKVINRREGTGQPRWRQWYNTPRWRQLRRKVLLRDALTCRRCGFVGLLHVKRGQDATLVMVANHRRPHRGDEAMFWDEGNLECVCTPCHSSDIQKEENAGRIGGMAITGLRVDEMG